MQNSMTSTEPNGTHVSSLHPGQPPTSELGATLPPDTKSALPALEIIDLCKMYGNTPAVDHLSLTVHQGEIFGLLGPNGSGKTTTINMISGLSPQTSGEIRIMGLSVKKNSRQVRQILGFVPQETALYEELSAYRNLDFHADLFGIPRKEKKQRINTMLETVQLDTRKESLVHTFSGGMKRRLAIARALLHDPKLIYLDEPTIGVDVQARRAIWGYILSLRAQGKTVLITTNYLEEAKALCDRVAIIDHGKLITQDSPKHLEQMYGGDVLIVDTDTQVHNLENIKSLKDVTSVAQDGNRLTVTATNAASLVAPIISLLHTEGRIMKIELRAPDLDDIFIKLTGAALRD
jgi:ABC-2 type transport system ATP-binding protein